MRRIVEAPDIEAGSGHAFAAILGNTLAKILATRPLDRAILLFIARTIGRSRHHRLLLAAYSLIMPGFNYSFKTNYAATPAPTIAPILLPPPTHTLNPLP